MPQNTLQATYNPEHGGSHMDITPLDPRQGQPTDNTVPHATDTVIPDVRPNVQQPDISPIGLPDPSARPILPTVAPGEYKTGSTGITRT